MFNPLTPAEVVAAIGATARNAARSDDAGGEFERSQLLSAYSACRHLSAELAAYEPELARFRALIVERVRAHGGRAGAFGPRLVEAHDAAALGAALGDLLEELRRSDAPPGSHELRTDLHALLRQLADREVDLLADALG